MEDAESDLVGPTVVGFRVGAEVKRQGAVRGGDAWGGGVRYLVDLRFAVCFTSAVKVAAEGQQLAQK